MAKPGAREFVALRGFAQVARSTQVVGRLPYDLGDYSMTSTTFQDLLGIVFIALGLFCFVLSSQFKRGKRKPSTFWGRSATEAFWQGIGCLAWGLGMLSRFVVPQDVAAWLYIAGALVFIVALLVGRKKAAAKT